MSPIRWIKSRGDKLADALLQPINPSGIVIMGFLLFMWGVWVASPFWDVFTTARSYQRMEFMPESCWGLISMAVASLVFYGVWRPSYSTLTRASLAGFFYFLAMTGLYISGDWHNASWLSPLTFTIYCAWQAVNLRANKHRWHA